MFMFTFVVNFTLIKVDHAFNSGPELEVLVKAFNADITRRDLRVGLESRGCTAREYSAFTLKQCQNVRKGSQTYILT